MLLRNNETLRYKHMRFYDNANFSDLYICFDMLGQDDIVPSKEAGKYHCG